MMKTVQQEGAAVGPLALDVSSCALIAENEKVVSASREVKVSGVMLRVLADILQQRGIAAERWLRGQLLEAMSTDPHGLRIPLSQYEALFADAIRLTGDQALGLHCGIRASESSFGLLPPLISHSRTLRDGIRLMCRFHPLVLEGVWIELRERSGIARLRVEFPRSHSAFDRGLAELMVAGLTRALRAFGCAESDIHEVCFEHAPPPHRDAYRALFGDRARFGQPFTGVDFSAATLDRDHLHFDPELQGLVRERAEGFLDRLSKPRTMVEALHAVFLRQPSGLPPNMEQAAKQLGISVRTLRRRLREEGSSYQAVFTAARQQTACVMLRNPDLSLQFIADSLGFADATTFHRAFKRWTGFTPTEYRKRALSETMAPGV